MRVTTQQIILEVLSADLARGEEVPVRVLIRAAEAFGIAANSVRVALVRLCADGRVASGERRGHYRLGEASRPLHERVASWRELERLVGAWNGAWIGVHTAAIAPSDRTAQRKLDRALKLWGFRPLIEGLAIRPANLRLSIDELRRSLLGLGLPADAAVFEIRELGPLDRSARSAWDSGTLERGYAQMREQLEQSEERLEELPLEDAARESFLLGREAIRRLVLDPLLPEPLVAVPERRALAEAMQRYDKRGRRIWKRFVLEAIEETR